MIQTPARYDLLITHRKNNPSHNNEKGNYTVDKTVLFVDGYIK